MSFDGNLSAVISRAERALINCPKVTQDDVLHFRQALDFADDDRDLKAYALLSRVEVD